MKICSEHWKQLRQGVSERGMDHLVKKNGEEAVAQMERELRGTADPKTDFDPLMAANWAISGAALRMGGFYLMTQKDDGTDWCPLCEADAHGGHAQDWVNGCLDAQLRYAREQGLVAPPS